MAGDLYPKFRVASVQAVLAALFYQHVLHEPKIHGWAADLALLLAVALVLIAPSLPAAPQSTPNAPKAAPAPSPSGKARSLTFRVGDTVRVVFENDGIVPHTWTLDENSPSPYSVTTRWLDPGETETVEFTADRPGAYAYYCAVPGHRELGMEGQIVIEG